MVVDGRPGGDDVVFVRSQRRPGAAEGVGVSEAGPGLWRVAIRFEGPAGEYARRELSLPLP